MTGKLIITGNFEKSFVRKKFITEDVLLEKAEEIEQGIFRAGEGRIQGSKIIYKKRFALPGTSKRKGGRILYVVFCKMVNLYIYYTLWMANNSRKDRFDQQLKSKKYLENIIRETAEALENSSG